MEIKKLILLTMIFMLFIQSAFAWKLIYDTKAVEIHEAWKNHNNKLMVNIDDLTGLIINDYVFNFQGWQLTMLSNKYALVTHPNSKIYIRDGFEVELSSTPVIKDNKIWIPLYDIAHILELEIILDTENEVILLKDKVKNSTKKQDEKIYQDRLRSVFNNIKFPRPDIAYWKDILIPVSSGYIPARIYDANPEDARIKVLYVNIHGGAFSLGSLASSDHVMRDLAIKSGEKVISIDYRMIPEYPFPAAWEDIYDAVSWIYNNSIKMNIDSKKIILGGDSAGANIANGVSMKLKNNNIPIITGLALFYPIINGENEMWKGLFINNKDAKNPYVSPLYGDLKNMPKALIYVAENDDLRAEGENYAMAYKKAGNTLKFKVVPSSSHGFLATNEQARQELADFIKSFRYSITN